MPLSCKLVVVKLESCPVISVSHEAEAGDVDVLEGKTQGDRVMHLPSSFILELSTGGKVA